MKWMTWWLLCWLFQSFDINQTKPEQSIGECCESNQQSPRPKQSHAQFCTVEVNNIFNQKQTKKGYHNKGKDNDTIRAVKCLEQVLEETEVNETALISAGHLVALLHKPQRPFRGLNIHASKSKAMLDKTFTNSTVSVQLPGELNVGWNNTIVFCMITSPETNWTTWGASDLYEGRLVGLSVRGKNITGLQERVNITMTLTMGINETQKPTCEFFNFTIRNFSSNGCLTLWERDESQITCSCDHLTYFGVLLVDAILPPTDLKILTLITQIGCSLSLFALVITVLLFISNRKIRADVSMRVHINLTIALILLNLHFLPSQSVAAQSSSGLCIYMALALHYSLLATFSWMALEGFHIYLLLVRVFNIYVRRYLLKLSLVGWGIPAVIVSLVVIIDRGTYGRVFLDLSNSNSNAICYIVNNTVKMVTTVGVFCLVFAFNIIMLGVTVRRVVSFRQRKEFGQSDSDRAKRDICTLLGVTILLGITWGLVFFSFGYLTIPGLYVFCILNSLQGFFIFLWFLMSLRKTGNSVKTSRETPSTNS
ncbi:adhesion G-protein coupled receptor G2-like [Micropterus salmoides]|uniref:adhesion G-protein coupled receptor G2-like n=1 Tax=Micropterus salmoides TaxID=27706 RepID=UPI0018EDE65B|nr:adhesion G-protein coupled receptor G2-like [Micropterus salmoides]